MKNYSCIFKSILNEKLSNSVTFLSYIKLNYYDEYAKELFERNKLCNKTS